MSCIHLNLKFVFMNTVGQEYLQTAIRRLKYYKDLGDKTFEQLGDKDFHYQPDQESNSIAVIIQHIYGNMLSRWKNLSITKKLSQQYNTDTSIKDPAKKF